MTYTISCEAEIEIEIKARGNREAIKKATAMLDEDLENLKILCVRPLVIDCIDREDGDRIESDEID